MRRIAITGASGAIGSALALEYAASDVFLWLQGRQQEALERVARLCQARGAEAATAAFDLRDFAALLDWTRQVVTRGAPDLLNVNAGLSP